MWRPECRRSITCWSRIKDSYQRSETRDFSDSAWNQTRMQDSRPDPDCRCTQPGVVCIHGLRGAMLDRTNIFQSSWCAKSTRVTPYSQNIVLNQPLPDARFSRSGVACPGGRCPLLLCNWRGAFLRRLGGRPLEKLGCVFASWMTTFNGAFMLSLSRTDTRTPSLPEYQGRFQRKKPRLEAGACLCPGTGNGPQSPYFTP